MRISFPRYRSHSFKVLSREHETMNLFKESMPSPVTSPLCVESSLESAVNKPLFRPDCMKNFEIWPVWKPTTPKLPHNETATAVTFVCTVRGFSTAILAIEWFAYDHR